MLPNTVRHTKSSVCTNCGNLGHHFRSCTAPVTSYGILAFRVADSEWNQAEALAKQDTELTGIPQSAIEVLMIQRRDSIGYVEIIRAKYKLTDIEYIQKQIEGITSEEREKLRTKTFEELWYGLWGTNASETKQYRQEYDQANLKFEALRKGYTQDDKVISFEAIFKSTPVLWDTPEWGFPKGRRNTGESDYSCAIREFNEETNLNESHYRVFENIETIRESFYGNNGIHYCHIYYLAWVSSNVSIKMNQDNEYMSREVGNIGWFSLEDAMKRIRSTNIQKREILSKVSTLLQTACPLLIGPIKEIAAQSTRKEAENTNRKQGNESNPWQQQRHIRA